MAVIDTDGVTDWDTFTVGCLKDPGVGVSGGEVTPGSSCPGTAVVGVGSASSGSWSSTVSMGCSPSHPRFCMVRLRICGVAVGDERSANSCAPRRGGGMNGEPGEGNGDDEAGLSIESERREESER